jgi:hypothetical protein
VVTANFLRGGGAMNWLSPPMGSTINQQKKGGVNPFELQAVAKRLFC